MIVILFLGRGCKKYLKRYSKKRPSLSFTCENETCACRPLHAHSHYFRRTVTKHQSFRIPIYRWRCPVCKRTLSVLPDFLVPGAHFLSSVREAAVKRRKRGLSWKRIVQGVASLSVGGISPRTVKRWWKRSLQRSGDASQWCKLAH